MISAGKVTATGGGKCWERGNVCNDRNDYPICVGTQNEGGPLYGMQNGYFGMENIPPDKRAKIFTPGTKFKDVQGICRSTLKKQQADGSQPDYDYFFYKSFIGAAGSLAIFNLSDPQSAYQYERQGFELTVGEMKALIEAANLGNEDFKVASRKDPSKAITAARLPADMMEKIVAYLFIIDYERLNAIIDKLSSTKIAGLSDGKKKALIAHLELLRGKTPEVLQKKAETESERNRAFQVEEGDKNRQFQADEGKKGRDAMNDMTDRNLSMMLYMGIGSLLGIIGATTISTLVMKGISNKQLKVMTDVADRQLKAMEKQLAAMEAATKKQLDMMSESLVIQKKSVDAIQSMDQKPKITDVASDLVEDTKRQFAEDVAETVGAAVKTAKEAADKAAKTPGYVPTAAEAEAEQLVARLSGAANSDAQALALLDQLAANKNHEALVNQGTFNAPRDVAERAAYLIATGDSRVPQAMQGRGIWWETDPSFDVVGRREDALQLAMTLARGEYQNAFLAGETGVGKFEVVRALAVLIARDDPDLPPELRGKKLWHVNNTSMIAGTKYRGTFADKQQVLEHAMFKDGDIVYVEELRTQLNAGATMQGDAEQYSAWLLRTLTKKESRFIGDGKPDDHEVIVGQGASSQGLRDFRRRLQLHNVNNLHPSMIRKSLEEQLSRKLGREKNCTVEPAAVEAAVRLGIAYREHPTSPPFDAAKSVLLNATMLARRGVPEGTHFTVTADHVVLALEQSTGMTIDRTAGAEIFDPVTRPHTEYPHLRAPQAGNGNGGSNGNGTTIPFETRVSMAGQAMTRMPRVATRFMGREGDFELTARKAVMLWDMVRKGAAELIDNFLPPADRDNPSQYAADVPRLFVEEIASGHDTQAAAPETTIMSAQDMTVEMAKQEWFRLLHPDRQNEIVFALREAARNDIVRVAGFITPEGMFTVEGQNMVLEKMGFNDRSLEPVRVVNEGGREVENRREEVKRERRTLVDGLRQRAAEAAAAAARPGPRAP